jgi:hypothetical protein
MDPNGEARRLGIKLNEGVHKADKISGDSKQVLAGNDDLLRAANKHSDWMLESDLFSHTETVKTKSFTGKDPTDRMKNAGYDTTGSFVGGENIAFTGSTGKIDRTAAINAQYRDLFIDKGIDGRGHRLNILNEDYREIGVGQEIGKFKSGGTNFNASMITQDFGATGTDVFVTGVVYNDTKKKDDFFSVGEQVAGRQVSSPGATDDTTGAGGGYELSFSSGAGPKTVTFHLSGGNVTVDLTVGSSNLKVDVVNGNEVWTNASIGGVSSNVKQIHALGIDDIDLTGSSSGEKFYGNGGQNTFTGDGGNDTFVFHRGDTAKSNARADIIADFNAGDIIDVDAMDANSKKKGDQDFKFIDGADFHGKAGELRFFDSGGDTFVQGDTNGDGKADFVIRLTGVVALTDAQFDL